MGSEADTQRAELSHLGSLHRAGEADEMKLILIMLWEVPRGSFPQSDMGAKRMAFMGQGTRGSLEDIIS